MKERVRLSSIGRQGGIGEIRLSGIPEELLDMMEGVILGQHWMTVKDGKLSFSPTREQLPNPVEDTEMLPFWRQHEERQGYLQEMSFDPEKQSDSPSFMVKHLCGYHYTPENYRTNAKLLESYGFVCMRSQRGRDGRFWETWYLPGMWAAKGELKWTLEKKQDGDTEKRDETSRVVSFLCRNVSFGELDVVVQRAAMALDD